MQLEEIGNRIFIIEDIKNKGKMSVLVLDVEKLKVYPETVEELNLHIFDKVDEEKYALILSTDKKYHIYHYLKHLVLAKPYSENQLFKKAIGKFGICREVRLAMNKLKEDNLVSDAEYLENYLEYFNNNNFGAYYIKNYLKTNGIKGFLLENIEFPVEIETEKAKNYFNSIKNKYIGSNFTKQKKKIYNAMLKRGFSIDVINEVLSGLEIDDSKEIAKLQKDYKKLMNKYKGKYQGETLNGKVVASLINMGYDFNKIRDVLESDGETFYVD